jgi:hypothetical protein
VVCFIVHVAGIYRYIFDAFIGFVIGRLAKGPSQYFAFAQKIATLVSQGLLVTHFWTHAEYFQKIVVFINKSKYLNAKKIWVSYE